MAERHLSLDEEKFLSTLKNRQNSYSLMAVLDEMIENEPDMAVRSQADQYQTDLSKTIEAYKNLEKALGGRQNEKI